MKSVAILVFPGVQSLDVSGPLDVFAEANRFLLPASQYRMELIGLTRGAVPCSNGMLLVPQRHYAEVDEAPDLLLVAGGPDLPAAREPDEGLAWLRGPVRAPAVTARSATVSSCWLGQACLPAPS